MSDEEEKKIPTKKDPIALGMLITGAAVLPSIIKLIQITIILNYSTEIILGFFKIFYC